MKKTKNNALLFIFPVMVVLALAYTALAEVPSGPIFNRALELDGATSYVMIDDHPDLDLTNAYTIEAWIYKMHSFYNVCIVSKAEIGKDPGYRLYTEGADICIDGMCTDSILEDDRWYHVAAVNDGVPHLYLDGEEQTLFGTPQTNFANKARVVIGAELGSPTNFFAGQIDDVRIWSVARTEAEIRDNMYRELEGSETGLVAYYPFNNETGDTVSDATGNHDGSIFGLGTTRVTSSILNTLHGEGTEANPWIIGSRAAFDAFCTNSGYWTDQTRLVIDLDLGDTNFVAAPIAPDNDYLVEGHQGTKFTGVFDGNGHGIRNLTISGNNDYLGLFGYIDTSTACVRDLGIEDGETRTDLYANKRFIARLCGHNHGTITRCFSTGQVRARSGQFIGGLCGQNDGRIIDCYATGLVYGDYDSVGYNGIAGLCGYNARGVIRNCYYNTPMGPHWALVARNDHLVDNCFWSTETSDESAGGTGLPNWDLSSPVDPDPFFTAGWNFPGTWVMTAPRPVLRGIGSDTDGDSLPDEWERASYGDILHNRLYGGDSDGLNDGAEYDAGTCPTLANTDGDWFSDSIEVETGMNPFSVDKGSPDDALKDYVVDRIKGSSAEQDESGLYTESHAAANISASTSKQDQYGLYTEEAIRNVQLGSLLIGVDLGVVNLDFEPQWCDDLGTTNWQPFTSGTWQTNGNGVRWIDTGISDKCFYRILSEE